MRIWAQKFQITHTAEEQNEIAEKWLEEIKLTQNALTNSIKNFTSEEAKNVHTKAINALDNYAKTVNDFQQISLLQRNEQAVQKKDALEAKKTSKSVGDGVYQFINTQEQKAWLYTLVITITSVLFGIIIGIIITRSITGPSRIICTGLTELVRIAQSVSTVLKEHLAIGDWSKTINMNIAKATIREFALYSKQNNEIGEMCKASISILKAVRNAGDATNKCIKQVNITLNQIKLNVAQVATASNQVSSAAQALSEGATESAASLEEMTSSMTQMSSQTNANAEILLKQIL